jgi:hypothetical protein
LAAEDDLAVGGLQMKVEMTIRSLLNLEFRGHVSLPLIE